MKVSLRIDDRERGGCRACSAHPRPGARARGAEAERVDDFGLPGQGVHRRASDQTGANTSKLDVTENGQAVSGLAVAPPGGSKSGAILLIDASNSMKGAPIQNAMAAARAFLAERKKDLPVAIVVFGPDDTVLSDFTTN